MLRRTYKIDRKAIESLPEFSYTNPVTMVTSVKQLNAAIIRLLGHTHPAAVTQHDSQVLGLDLEWRAMLEPDVYNRTALLQLYVPGTAVIVRLNKLIDEAGGFEKFVFPKILADILRNPYLLKVGLNVKQDAKRLYNDFGIECQGCADIGDLPIHRLCQPKGLAGLAALFMGIKVSKKEATSNWEASRLSANQIRYAAADAFLSRELYLTMYSKSLGY